MAPATEELQLAQADIFHDVLFHNHSMSLKCAIELGIPDLIQAHGGPTPLSTLISQLSLSPSKSSALRRLLRLLSHKGYFAVTSSGGEPCYSLTPLSRLLLDFKKSPASLSPWALVSLGRHMLDPAQVMSQWYRQPDSKAAATTILELCHGKPIYALAGEDPEFNSLFNDAMSGGSHLHMKSVVANCREAFKGVTSLVDVGGGDGTSALAIAEAFPGIHCKVYDLPHVIAMVPKNPLLELIGGDMFDHIPTAQTVFLKFTLHNWSDEDSVKVLKLCKEAIPSREEGGKVLIMEMVVGSGDAKTTETQLLFDVEMMTVCDGKEREEHEWKKIFMDAGFSDYKITPLGVPSLIEVFP